MNLGTASLARAGINYLASGFCEEHGLLWTDGRNVNICGIKAIKRCLERFLTKTLMQLDQVDAVLWGYRIDANNRIITVQCPNVVKLFIITKSIRISGEGKKLDYYVNNCRDINSKSLLNGILWHPFLDIVCIISKFYSTIYLNNVGQDKPASLALDPKFSSENAAPMQCGCWSIKGNYFIIGSSSNIVIYHWKNIKEKITEYVVRTFCLDIIETLIIALKCQDERYLICTSRYQLKTKANDRQCLLKLEDKEDETQEDHIDPSIIRFKRKDDSIAEKLKSLCITECNTEKYSQVILVDFIEETILSTFNLTDILTPDILECTNMGCILVSGHASSKVYQFRINKDADKIFQNSCLSLNTNERAKGICKLSDENNQFLLLNAICEEEQPSFQFSILGKYSIRVELLVYQERLENDDNRTNSPVSISQNSASPSQPPYTIFIPNNFYSTPFEYQNYATLPMDVNQHFPTLSVGNSPSASIPCFEMQNMMSSGQIFFNESSKSYEMLPGTLMSNLNPYNNIQAQKMNNLTLPVSRMEEAATNSFSGIQDITNDWKENIRPKEESHSTSNASPNEFLDNNSRPYQSFDSMSYPSLSTPPIVYITLHSDTQTITKNFLLDGDKLKYAAVLDVFNLANVEIMIGTEFCYVSPNVDGYIPLSFESGCQIHITGRRKI
ncbi:DgyrCDS10990 [Dimorphilus gyrociliatus]|uniref:WD repeat and coiled-coil-containing protein n=1 Tax=Dimorphilus gyrociliatus TaxID=2664684 RepID=A0A7I8W233_9ANNE|nr:DgyrCDS10990 [Dimorphilus gyrociliatus]